MSFIKKLVGWFFTYPAYRDITASQSEGVVAFLTLALYADGEPHETEREELERELTGVPHYWADEETLRRIVAEMTERWRDEPFEALAQQTARRVEGLSSTPEAAQFLLTGAAFVCNGDSDLTALERENLAVMGRALGLADEVIERIVSDPESHSRAMFERRDDTLASG